ncbi:M14 family metallopeptidase [Aliikangiella sp. IMCC44653]
MSNASVQTKTKPWGEVEKQAWLEQQQVQRSYFDDILSHLDRLKEGFLVEKYGELSYDKDRYPLYAFRTFDFASTKPTILVTGGVHGYETSGVHGALRFLDTKAHRYAEFFNVIVLPCISPWGYETINRWNPYAVDPNRSFVEPSPAEEAALAMTYVKPYLDQIIAHIDLHETTDTDNTTFRPALAARDGIEQAIWTIPDGFYLVGNSKNPQPAFQKAIIDAVKPVTHIAPADDNGQIIGAKLEQTGVINYDTKKLGLCAGMTNADYVTTTEVYPDSPKVNPENCIEAQVAAVCGGLDFLICQK